MVQSSLNILGSYAVAAFTAGSKIDNIFTQAFVAIGTTMSTYSAQNVGARKLDRVRQGFRCADVIGCAYAVVVGFVLFFVGKNFSYLFISDNAEAVIPMVDTYLRCGRAYWKRCDGSCCSRCQELYNGMHGQSICMDCSNSPSYCTLLLCDEGYEEKIMSAVKARITNP